MARAAQKLPTSEVTCLLYLVVVTPSPSPCFEKETRVLELITYLGLALHIWLASFIYFQTLQVQFVTLCLRGGTRQTVLMPNLPPIKDSTAAEDFRLSNQMLFLMQLTNSSIYSVPFPAVPFFRLILLRQTRLLSGQP